MKYIIYWKEQTESLLNRGDLLVISEVPLYYLSFVVVVLYPDINLLGHVIFNKNLPV